MKAIGRWWHGLRSGKAAVHSKQGKDADPMESEVVGRIWVSTFPGEMFDKIGLRHKYRGEPWEEPYPNFHVPQRAVDDLPHMERYNRGELVSTEHFPEASAIYAPERFPSGHPVSIAGIGYLVNDDLAKILRGFDIGPGGMFPHVIYEADEVTPIPESWWFLGLGAQKRSFLPGKGRKFQTVVDGKGIRDSIYRPWPNRQDDDLTFSREALTGPDLWAERELGCCLLMSLPLGQALKDAGFAEVFELRTALVVA